ncbi:ATP-binding cassette domain-containing protein [Bacillus sp. SD088]|uniref:ATP-binding cassette domain-containing protein n=1 Tax=Bacillus sp. SD088 TaxID=2782012 RepID=UPI001A95F54E|nr:ATP-binding cassette domain-containing protein [Bacillus sp. SD088]MBO0995545.1 ATP-binding cassette domain-containing protein [Bacillus sp. SD088]
MRISLNNIACKKEGIPVLKDITCSFGKGLTYIVGKNGAGKSTLLKLIATAVTPDEGNIAYTKLLRDPGMGMHRQQISVEEIRQVIGFMPQHFTGYPEMTIERYLKHMAFHKGIPHQLVKSLIKEWLKDAGLMEIKRKKLRNLSGGQRQKAGLIQALINQPRLCILDEPFEGLDTKEKLFFKRILHRLSYHSIIIVSTHLLEEIEQTADANVLYLSEGDISFYGGADEVDRIVENLTIDVEKG